MLKHHCILLLHVYPKVIQRPFSLLKESAEKIVQQFRALFPLQSHFLCFPLQISFRGLLKKHEFFHATYLSFPFLNLSSSQTFFFRFNIKTALVLFLWEICLRVSKVKYLLYITWMITYE